MRPTYSAADYLSALQSLMPRGRAWPRSADAVQTKVLGGLTPVYERQTARAQQLLADALPLTTFELLPEWEQTLGLPNACDDAVPTVQGRRAQVVARFTALGGQSVGYMQSVAWRLGYSITISQFVPARAGNLRAGLPLCGNAFAHAWQVNVPRDTSIAFVAGASTAGEPLSVIGNAVLECELQRVAPAHTTVFFNYF